MLHNCFLRLGHFCKRCLCSDVCFHCMYLTSFWTIGTCLIVLNIWSCRNCSVVALFFWYLKTSNEVNFCVQLDCFWQKKVCADFNWIMIGRFLAEVTKGVLSDLEASKYQVLLRNPVLVYSFSFSISFSWKIMPYILRSTCVSYFVSLWTLCALISCYPTLTIVFSFFSHSKYLHKCCVLYTK